MDRGVHLECRKGQFTNTSPKTRVHVSLRIATLWKILCKLSPRGSSSLTVVLKGREKIEGIWQLRHWKERSIIPSTCRMNAMANSNLDFLSRKKCKWWLLEGFVELMWLSTWFVCVCMYNVVPRLLIREALEFLRTVCSELLELSAFPMSRYLNASSRGLGL